jgi:erythromycin esterase
MRRTPCIGLALAACVLAYAAPSAAQRPLNLHLEQPGLVTPDAPWGWWLSDQQAAPAERQAALDSTVARGGRFSLRVARPAPGGPAWSGATYLPADGLGGKRLRLSGWARTQDLRDGAAALRLETLGPGYAILSVDSMPGRGVRGSAGWTRLTLEATVDSAALVLGVGVQASGAGAAWFDDLELEVDGVRITDEPGAPALTEAQQAWIRSRAVPLAGVEPGGDDGDLAALDRVIGDARLVSLGEGTHGTREFYQLKHRIIEHLVRRRGFGVVMLEANQLQTERLNRYVLYGEGNAREAMSGLFRILRTEEVLAMVEWARALNASGAGRVEIIGYDMQDPRLPIDSVLAFLARRDPALASTADSAYHDMREAWRPGPYPARPDSVVRVWSGRADRVRRVMAERQGAWRAHARTAADSAEIAWAVQNAEVAWQAASLGDETALTVRERGMALNIEWALRQRGPATRAVIWAHNSHVSRTPDWMGDFVEQRLPGQARVFALTTAEGEYSAAASFQRDARSRPFGVFPIVPAAPPAGGVAHALAQVDAPVLLLDVREAATSRGGEFLLEPRPFLNIGGAGVDYGYFPESVGRTYDAILFIRRTTATRLLQ